MLIGEPEPVTRRRGDRKWPKIRDIVKGKDDENFVEKSAIMMRYTGMATAFCSMFDIIIMPHKNPGVATAVSRIAWWGVPFIGGGLVYTSTVNLLSNARGGKTDCLNHFGGGVAVGALLGKHSRSILTGFVMGTGLGIMAMYNKEFEVWGMDPYSFPENKRIGGPFTYQRDWTLKKDRHGYYARSEEEVPAIMERGDLTASRI